MIMFIVKVALYNSQKSVTDEKGSIGFDFCSQKIVDISFNGFGEHIYAKQDRVKQIETKDDNKILWRGEHWNSLSEEYVVVSSKEPFAVTIEETYEEIRDDDRKSTLNKLATLDSIEVVSDDEEKGWNILFQDDRKYAVINTANPGTLNKTKVESNNKIQKPKLGIIEGGKKKGDN